MLRSVSKSQIGISMTDTLPASTVPGMVNGAQLRISNVDSVTSDTVRAGAGTLIGGRTTVVVPPGLSIALTYNGSGAWNLLPGAALVSAAQSQSFPYVAPPALNLPIQYAQIYGPANIQDIFNAAGNVTFFWNPIRPVPGIFSGLDVTAYRIGPSFTVPE